MSPKPRNNGQWTEARFSTFIKSLLRGGTRRWGPKNRALQKARVAKGQYKCAGCLEIVPVTVKTGDKRKRNVFVDHINPVVNLDTGFTSWDEYIERMFCEEGGFQVLCDSCHTAKTSRERKSRGKK